MEMVDVIANAVQSMGLVISCEKKNWNRNKQSCFILTVQTLRRGQPHTQSKSGKERTQRENNRVPETTADRHCIGERLKDLWDTNFVF